MDFYWILLFILVAVVAFVIARRTAPAPKFGLSEARRIRDELGGLTPDTANVARIAVAVGGLEFLLQKDGSQRNDILDSRISQREILISSWEDRVVMAKKENHADQKEVAEVSDLLSIFSVS